MPHGSSCAVPIDRGTSPPPVKPGMAAAWGKGSIMSSPSQSLTVCDPAAIRASLPVAIMLFSAMVRLVTTAMVLTGPFMMVMVEAPITPTIPTAPNSIRKTFPASRNLCVRFLLIWFLSVCSLCGFFITMPL